MQFDGRLAQPGLDAAPGDAVESLISACSAVIVGSSADRYVPPAATSASPRRTAPRVPSIAPSGTSFGDHVRFAAGTG